MPFHLFQYALPGPGELEDLNAFLANHRVVACEHHVVTTPGGAQLVFVVQTTGSARSEPTRKAEPKVDYRALLPPEQFRVYSALRDLRKQIAEAEGVPVYTVFTNAQLAEMVQKNVRTAGELGAIDGVGSARVERYGERMLARLLEDA